MQEKEKNAIDVALGGWKQFKGGNFERKALKRIFLELSSGSLIGAQVILDYPVIDGDKLTVYEVKNYKNTSSGIAEAKKSLVKITNDPSLFELKVITSGPSNNSIAIYIDEKDFEIDANFRNSKAGIKTKKDVDQTHKMLIDFFTSEVYFDELHKLISSFSNDEYIEEVEKINNGTKGKLFRFFISIDEVKKIRLNRVDKTKNKFVSMFKDTGQSIGNLRGKLYREKVENYFETRKEMEEKWKLNGLK